VPFVPLIPRPFRASDHESLALIMSDAHGAGAGLAIVAEARANLPPEPFARNVAAVERRVADPERLRAVTRDKLSQLKLKAIAESPFAARPADKKIEA
jgi:hypothetical protein